MSESALYSSHHREASASRSGNNLAAGDPNVSPEPQQQHQEQQQHNHLSQTQPARHRMERPSSQYSGHSQVFDLQQGASSAELGQHHEFEHRQGDLPPQERAQDTAAHDTHHNLGSPTFDDDRASPFPDHPPSKYRDFRLRVMRMATVPRLQLLWGLLAAFGSMAWMAITPAYAFRNKLGPTAYSSPSYTFFLIATVGTSVASIWQSLCPLLVRQSQRSLLPRIINHPATQTTTIVISVLLTAINFFSWIVLASYKDGAKTNCHKGPDSDVSGYVMQCRGVNVAIVLDVVVFLLWIPISIVIVCGTLERGLWWWGEDDGWAHNEGIAKGSNMMSEEEFDLKIGLGGRSRMRRNNRSQENASVAESQMIQRPKPAFVTPIASQFRADGDTDMGASQDQENADFGEVTPSSYRRHHQQRQQPQQQQQQQQQQPRSLVHKSSNSSLAPSFSARLSTFFGAGWSNGPMPPPEEQPPTPSLPSQYRPERSRLGEEHSKPASEASQDAAGDKTSIHGDAYTTQWHNRRHDDWS
ncbi:hypothetical protein EMPS_08348 [Entomortierella parvispora]|uniref:Uncharacterized protein n=1 Tax=Entomortierella parvispora TaxID=205924 RepID=A0A9P3HFV0_9FUNG|nr:hypothetical protein EMPS_08348 [Entomortierella parvispora]